MPPVTARTTRIEFDKALQYAVTLAWKDLIKVYAPRSVLVEYLREPGTALDHLRVWVLKDRGYRDLVCDYWTRSSPVHASGASFRNAYSSENLAEALEFVAENEELFTRAKDSASHALVLIYPPDANDLIGAATWMTEVKAFAGALTPQPANDHRSIGLAWSQPDDAPPSGRATTLSDATGYSD